MDQSQEPVTPCSERCAHSHLEHLNMTNPDERQSQSQSSTPPQSPAIPQPNFNAPALNLHVPINIDNPFAINNDPAVPNYAEPAGFGIINLLSPAEHNSFSDELHLLLT